MLLYINTSEFHKIELVLLTNNTVLSVSKDLAFNENYKSLEVLQKFLVHHKIQLQDLKKIIVCSGPGSFTGIRVGVSLAQGLGYGLNIPVYAIPKNRVPSDFRKFKEIKLPEKLILHYGAQPNITKAKEKTRL